MARIHIKSANKSIPSPYTNSSFGPWWLNTIDFWKQRWFFLTWWNSSICVSQALRFWLWKNCRSRFFKIKCTSIILSASWLKAKRVGSLARNCGEFEFFCILRRSVCAFGTAAAAGGGQRVIAVVAEQRQHNFEYKEEGKCQQNGTQTYPSMSDEKVTGPSFLFSINCPTFFVHRCLIIWRIVDHPGR